jgi:hypothetical protein
VSNDEGEPGTYGERAIERQKTMVAKVARSREEVALLERERDAVQAPHERAEAIFSLTCGLMARGTDASEFRLDRSIAHVERRGASAKAISDAVDTRD